jgi:SAM-dependent methyltransferase
MGSVSKVSEVEKQRRYYETTATSYDECCAFDPNDEHFIAAALLSGLLSHFEVGSLLDVGCGTGRALHYLASRHPEICFHGIEPVAALRAVATAKGLREDQVSAGDACALAYPDGAFDCVSLFGVLHHVRTPETAIAEAARVSRRMFFISDHNIYGMGSRLTKSGKQLFRDVGLKKLLRLLMTRGKGYPDTDWDGVFYPFSLIDHYGLIRSLAPTVHLFPTKTPAVNLYRSASHVAVLAVKDPALRSEDGAALPRRGTETAAGGGADRRVRL